MKNWKIFAAGSAFLAGLTAVPALSVSAADGVNIRFRLKVPGSTPADAAVFITGSRPELGAWNPGEIRMKKETDGTYSINLLLEPGAAVEYKYTRGGWETVEKNEDGGEVQNRRLEIKGPMEVNNTVAAWGDGRKADLSLLDDINEMLEKMTLGRVVRTWEYRDERYCAFLPWSQITFAARENGNTSAA